MSVNRVRIVITYTLKIKNIKRKNKVMYYESAAGDFCGIFAYHNF